MLNVRYDDDICVEQGPTQTNHLDNWVDLSVDRCTGSAKYVDRCIGAFRFLIGFALVGSWDTSGWTPSRAISALEITCYRVLSST